MITVLLTVLCLILGLTLYRRPYWTLHHIPGPGFLAAIQNLFRVTDPSTNHFTLTKMAKIYGPVMHVSKLQAETLVVSGYEALHELLIKKGKEFGGRPAGATVISVERHLGIAGALKPDATWKTLRKITQHHIKQFGEGMTVLGHRVAEVAEDMYQALADSHNQPADPEPLIFKTIARSISFIIMGETPTMNDALLDKIMKYFGSAAKVATFNPPWSILFFDLFPLQQFFKTKTWKRIEEYKQIRDELWDEMKERAVANPDKASLIKALLDKTKEDIGELKVSTRKVIITENNARQVIMDIILAGIITTMFSFHAMINLLAHYPDIQDNIHQDIQQAVGTEAQNVTLDDRHKMNYTRAAIYELLRYTTVIAESLPHTCIEDSTLLGYQVYKGTAIRANLWALNHDPDLWEDPYTYKPSRFLDESRTLVPADHSSRKHLMAFGMGTRVCLGESLALARLFLLLSNLVKRFHITPAEGNTKNLTDCHEYCSLGSVTHSAKYKVRFQAR